MKNKEDLKKELIKIDHKSYGMYKTLGGSYSFGNYILYIDHVQGDPFASPSRLHFEVKRDRHGFPEEYYQEKHRRLALEDQVLRRFLYELRQIDKGFTGSGKSGRITICKKQLCIIKHMSDQCGLSIIYTTTGNKFKKTVHIRNNPPSFSFPCWLLRHHCQ